MSEIKPVTHLVWLQGRPAIDDVVDYYEVASSGDKCADGSDPFPVYDERAISALRSIIERAQAIVSTSTYPNWHASASAALKGDAP